MCSTARPPCMRLSWLFRYPSCRPVDPALVSCLGRYHETSPSGSGRQPGLGGASFVAPANRFRLPTACDRGDAVLISGDHQPICENPGALRLWPAAGHANVSRWRDLGPAHDGGRVPNSAARPAHRRGCAPSRRTDLLADRAGACPGADHCLGFGSSGRQRADRLPPRARRPGWQPALSVGPRNRCGCARGPGSVGGRADQRKAGLAGRR